MYEQASNQFLALSKQAAETFIKANAIAVEGFEKLMDCLLYTSASSSMHLAARPAC